MLRPDVEIQRVYSQYWDEVRQKCRLGQKCLLVEGDDDRIAIEKLLEQASDPGSVDWTAKVVVAAASGRQKVLAKLKENPGWYGLVDRDTWDDGEVASLRADYPNLVITEGWCLENHFIQAAVLESSLNLPPGTLADLDAEWPDWISYGAIRLTTKRLRDAFSASLLPEIYGRPDRMASEKHDPVAIAEKLRSLSYEQHHASWDIARLAQQIAEQQQILRAMPGAQAALQGIHGKEFFRHRVVPRLNRIRHQGDENHWRTRILQGLGSGWPGYLSDLAARLLA